MKLVRSASLRGLIPALAVATVLAISFIAQPSSPFGSSVAFGYGYGGNNGNNCGVKGLGTHDHGKACPNRPFPGKGHTKDVSSGESSATTETTTTETTIGGPKAEGSATTNQTTTLSAETTSSSSDAATTSSKSHGHGKGHGRGRGHSQD